MASTYADRKFSYNPFVSNQVIRDANGTALFYKDPQTGSWMQSTENPKYGDMDFSAPSYSWSPYEGTPEGTPEWEYGVNWTELEKNNPELAAAWGQMSPGFMRDGTGYNHFQVIGYDPETGVYITQTKTGDKEGTVEAWGQGADGQWGVVKNLGTQEWDTNRNFTQQGAWQFFSKLIPMIGAVGSEAIGTAAAGGNTYAQAVLDAYNTVASPIKDAWNALSAPVQEMYGSFENWANSFGGPADIAGSAPDFGTSWTSSYGSTDPFSGPGDFIQPGGTFEGSALNINAPTPYNPMGEWPGAESNLGMPEFEMPPTTTTPGDPYGPNSSQDGSDPTGKFNNTPSGGSNVSSTTTPKGPNSIVKAVMDGLGISETAATLLVTSVPAIASLFSDHGDQTTTSTNGTPQQVAVKNQIADATAARLPEYMQRDRQRADQQMAWGNAAALVPQNYTLPAQVAAPGMVSPTFAANGAGMMGTYKPRGVMGLYG